MFPSLLLRGHETLQKLLNNTGLECNHTLSKILQALQWVYLLGRVHNHISWTSLFALFREVLSWHWISVILNAVLPCTKSHTRLWDQHVAAASAGAHTWLMSMHSTWMLMSVQKRKKKQDASGQKRKSSSMWCFPSLSEHLRLHLHREVSVLTEDAV